MSRKKLIKQLKKKNPQLNQSELEKILADQSTDTELSKMAATELKDLQIQHEKSEKFGLKSPIFIDHLVCFKS